MAKSIPVEDIEEGCILAEPVVNNYGQVLVPAGTTLMAKHKNLLNTWSVRYISIKDDDNEQEAEISNDLKLLAIDRLKARLKWNPRNENEKDLIKMGLINTAKIILKSNKRN